MVCSMRPRKSLNSSSAPCRVLNRAAVRRPSATLMAGILASDAARANTSRGFAASSVTRLSSRSRSRTPSSARRNSSRSHDILYAGFDGIEPRIDLLPIERRPQQPCSQQSLANRSNRGIDRLKKRYARIAATANNGSINSRFRTVTASSTRQFCRSYQPMRST